VLYGAAEFSRDADLAVLAEPENLERLRRALDELQAECIAVPPFERTYLEKGHAVHFRCHHAEARGVRIDVLSKMRGVDDFAHLWTRRSTVDVGGEEIDVLALPDLVQSKKTQRDKDWPMIARLLEASYFASRERATAAQVEFWLREMRTPALLVEAARLFPQACARLVSERALLALARDGADTELRKALRDEEEREREADRRYWEPLKREIEELRRAKRSGASSEGKPR
jgi:hypothetical protein